MKAAKRRGRPTKKPNEGERVSLGLRVTAELKRQLDAAAAASGRSQSQEAEFRIESSFASDERRSDLRLLLEQEWGPDIYNLAHSSASAVRLAEAHTGKRWVEDQRTFDVFTRTLLQLAQNYRDLVLRIAREQRPRA
jgi:hypothetical protein